METKQIASCGIDVTTVGLGTWELAGDVYGRKDDATSLEAIRTAIDVGVNFIDTAAGYGGGHSEELVGRALRDAGSAGNEIVVSTKVLPKCGTFAPPPEKSINEAYPPEWIVSQCEESLRRLKREHVDILFLHTWNPAWAHETSWHDAMLDLKRKGKIRAIGISIPDEGVADANVHIEARRVDVIQCVYNIFQQEPEYTLFPLAKKNNVAIIARSPFSSGALTGFWTKNMEFEEGDWRGIWPLSVKPGWLEEQVEMAELVREVVKRYDISMIEASLRYVLTEASVTSVIPGSSQPEHVRSNIQAADDLALAKELMCELKSLWLERRIHGTYNGSI